MDNQKKYILLRGLDFWSRSFFCENDPTTDQTKLDTGVVAYGIVGYADSVAEAQTMLYGRSFVVDEQQIARDAKR